MSITCVKPRILFVTPEVSFVPVCSGKRSGYRNYKSGGFASFLSHLASDLYEKGADVYITQPDYRRIFSNILQNSSLLGSRRLPDSRIHLTEDRAFFYSQILKKNRLEENIKISLAFQREVAHQILPRLQPDLIHCHDWMSGLIPAMALELGIPCIFTLQNCETAFCTLSAVEDIGIDGAKFWQHLFFDHFPVNYEETRETNAIDFLISGIFAACHATVAGPAAGLKVGKSLSFFTAEKLGNAPAEKLAVVSDVSTDYRAVQYAYIDLYERLLKCSVIKTSAAKFRFHDKSFQDIVKNNISSGTTGGVRYAQGAVKQKSTNQAVSPNILGLQP